MVIVRVTVVCASPSRKLDLLFALRASWGTVFRLLCDKPEKNLWGHFKTWVGGEKRFEHLRFAICHEFDTIVYIGKSAKDVDEGVSWDYWPNRLYVSLGAGQRCSEVVIQCRQ